MSRFLSGASVVVCAFGAATAALAGSAQIKGDPNQFHSLIEAVSSLGDADDYAIIENESSPLLTETTVRPDNALLAQEADAAALVTGRNFLALGKRRDDRATFVRIAAGDAEPPPGWRRDYHSGDEQFVHIESGLECPLSYDVTDGDRKRRLALTGLTQYDQRGRDVSCNYAIAGEVAITFYASFYPDLSLEDHASGAAAAIYQNFKVRKNLPVISIEITKEGSKSRELPPTLSGAFDVGEVNGVPYKTAVWIGKTHGWHVKTRATYPQSDFGSELLAAIMFQLNFINVDKKNLENPTTAGVEA